MDEVTGVFEKLESQVDGEDQGQQGQNAMGHPVASLCV